MSDPTVESPAPPRKRSMSRTAEVLFASGTIGNGLLPGFLVAWQLYYFVPTDKPALIPAYTIGAWVLGPATIVGLVNLIGQIVHSFADWGIGYASDRTRTRWGRRIPWIAISAPICTIAFMAIWWPPSAGAGWINLAWLAAIRSIMWVAYTGAVGPYCSLLPEVTEPGAERNRIAAFMAFFEVTGTIMAGFVASKIIDAYPDGGTIAGFHLTDGYKFAAACLSLISLTSMWISIAVVREKPYDRSKEVPFGPVQSLAETLKNPSFRPYAVAFIAFRIALNAILVVMPYQVSVLLRITDAESATGNLQAVIVLGSILFFPLIDWLVNRGGKRRVMLWGFFGFAVAMAGGGLIGRLPFGSPVAQAYLVYGLCAFPVATLFMLPRPIMADIIDLDAARTGYRREGIYNGAEGLLTKVAEGIGPFLAGALLDHFGSTAANPTGVILTAPVAGAICLIGWLLFLRYPIKT
ncbi:MAG: MFS transporter [Deltaproteobacteria bacterium]|nr:MFS transporter [Deltaproteobacteria bacterium]